MNFFCDHLMVNMCWNEMKNAVHSQTEKSRKRKMFALFYIIQFATATVKRNIKMRNYENEESVDNCYLFRVDWYAQNVDKKQVDFGTFKLIIN